MAVPDLGKPGRCPGKILVNYIVVIAYGNSAVT